MDLGIYRYPTKIKKIQFWLDSGFTCIVSNGSIKKENQCRVGY